MNEIGISKTDELVMKLLHYFITEQGYNPIVLQGAQNEIWLENLEGEYRIVRIVTNYIHNDEQLEFDFFKTRKIAARIKKKLLSWKMNVLCFYLNLGDNVDLDLLTSNSMLTCVALKDIEGLEKSDIIKTAYPTIMKDTNFQEEGLLLFAKLSQEINEKNRKDAMQAEEVFTSKKPVVTYFLMAINILMFILTYVLGRGSRDVPTLLFFGANFRSLVVGGQVWRLLASAFLHAGIVHLVFNMYALYVIGPQIENFFGKWRYLVIYLFSAICGNLLSVSLSPYVSVGASGAIFGLLGAMLYFGYHYRVYLGTIIRSQIIPIIVLNLGIGFMISGIDNAAHIGGLIGGIFISMAVGVKYKSMASDRFNGIVVSLIYLAFLSYLTFMM